MANLKIFWCGDSHMDPGNWNAVSPVSNGPTYGQYTNMILGANANGRWMPGGNTAGNLGQLYAVSGSGINVGGSGSNPNLPPLTSEVGQVNSILADYPVIPSASVIVLEGGFNDCAQTLAWGGLWSTSTFQISSGSFTVPAPGNNVTVTVPTASGITVTPGNNSLVAFPNQSGMILSITAIAGTSVTLTNYGGEAGAGGGTIPANSVFEAYGLYYLATSALPFLQTIVTNLQNAGATKIIIVNPCNFGLTPLYAANIALGNSTTSYWLGQLQSMFPASSTTYTSVSIFDANALWLAAYNAPINNGFRNVTSDWTSDGGTGRSEANYMWHNNEHPTTIFHYYMAVNFVQFLKNRGVGSGFSALV